MSVQVLEDPVGRRLPINASGRAVESKCLGSSHSRGSLGWISWLLALWPGPVPAVVGIWGRNPSMVDSSAFSLALSSLPLVVTLSNN